MTDTEKLRHIVGQLQQRLQPGGSPPPGDEVVLADWIIYTSMERIQHLEDAMADLVQPCDCGNPGGGNSFHQAQHRAMLLLSKATWGKCPTCNGAGSVKGKRCTECLGRGRPLK